MEVLEIKKYITCISLLNIEIKLTINNYCLSSYSKEKFIYNFLNT